MQIQEVHEQLLSLAIAHKKKYSDFTFSTRKKMDAKGRMAAGYWFRGNDNYIFFSPYQKSDWKNKTQTIGFVVNMRKEKISAIYYQVIFIAEDNRKNKEFYHEVLGLFSENVIEGKYKYKIKLESLDLETEFRHFLESVVPQINTLITKYRLNDSFFISETDYISSQNRIKEINRKGLTPIAVNEEDSETDLPDEDDVSYWIFQEKPEFFDVEAYLMSKRIITWTISQYKDEISQGDKVLIWKSGENAGVYATATVIDAPSENIPEDSPEFWSDSKESSKKGIRCRISIQRQFIEDPILRSSIKIQDWSENVSILTNAQGTNFKLNEETYRQILGLMTESNPDKNLIIYGPPGTGKTYGTITKALSIIEGKDEADLDSEKRSELQQRFANYRDEGIVCFTTFHQSFSYEDFVEGIRPSVGEGGSLSYSVEPGIFRTISTMAEKNWRASISESEANFQSLWKEYIIPLEDDEEIKVVTSRGFFTIYEVTDTTIRFEKNNGSRKHTLSVASLRRFFHNPELMESLGGLKTYYRAIVNALSKQKKSARVSVEKLQNYVLIIDEINRGNISKIFGELITLIEEDKRLGEKNELTVQLPYSHDSNDKDDFGVPPNLYIIGTMNTADRSIALMDTALRRRFRFLEVMPNSDLLDDYPELDVSLSSILSIINNRIEYLYDRDHTIGHAYFMNVKTKDELDSVMKNKIIPLLQEYFYDDWEKIQMVLGDHYRQFEQSTRDSGDLDRGINKYRFIKSRVIPGMNVLGFDLDDNGNQTKYQVNENFSLLSYRKIYAPKAYQVIADELKNEKAILPD